MDNYTGVYNCNKIYYVCTFSVENSEICDVWAQTFGAVDTLIFLVTLGLIVGAISMLRKKICESPVKRFCLLLISTVSLLHLINSAVGFSDVVRSKELCLIVIFLTSFLGASSIMYAILMLPAYLIQLITPFVHGESRRKNLKKVAVIVEMAVNIAILILALIIAGLRADDINGDCNSANCSGSVTKFAPIAFGVIVTLAFSGVVVFISALFYFQIRYLKTKKANLIISFFLSFVVISLMILLVTVYYAIHQIEGEGIIGAILRGVSDALQGLFVVAVFIFTFVRVRKCQCTKKITPLPKTSRLNELHTNPQSVWDHQNDPSHTTVFVPPPEMSDCVSDCRIFSSSYAQHVNDGCE